MNVYCFGEVKEVPEGCPYQEGDLVALPCEEPCHDVIINSGPCDGMYLRMHILESAASTQLAVQATGQRVRAPAPELIPLVKRQFDEFNREGFGELEFSALMRRLDRIDPSYRT